jgi:type I restriction enzyme, R subunit
MDAPPRPRVAAARQPWAMRRNRFAVIRTATRAMRNFKTGANGWPSRDTSPDSNRKILEEIKKYALEHEQRYRRFPKTLIFAVWANRDRDYNVRCLAKRLQRIEKEMAAEAREVFAAYIPGGDTGRFAAGLPAQIRTDFTATMQLLRNPAFQELLVNFPRRPRTFLRAIETVDEVTSEYHIRSGTGRDFKPQDYLTAFAQYVQQNPEQVEAIRIFLDRPQGWSTAALAELKTKLATAPDGFTVESLQKAHQACYKKSLVDIISMVKHAAREQEPLLTAEERVDRAFEQITAGREFTEEQQRWLDRIRAHLVENLSIDREDFDDLPVFTRHGGWAKANRDFQGQLEQLLKGVNEAVAA